MLNNYTKQHKCNFVCEILYDGKDLFPSRNPNPLLSRLNSFSRRYPNPTLTTLSGKVFSCKQGNQLNVVSSSIVMLTVTR